MTAMLYLKYRKNVQDLLKESKIGSLVEICLVILRVTLLYIFEILCFIKMNKNSVTQYSDIHKHNTKGEWYLYAQLCSTAVNKCN
jgi:hypothetical protein